jgi:hypothetical protein
MRALFRAAIVALVVVTLHARSSAGDLVVVAPRLLAESLKEFIAFKKTLLPTRLVNLEDILAAAEGGDDAEKLKRFLYEQWRGGKVAYVLLAGDADLLPVRYMVLDRITPAAFDYAFYPSDLYYADLARADGSFDDWNRQSEGFHGGYFGEVRGEKNKADPINFDGIDYRPEIAVGRWPVSRPEDARLLATKSIAAERERITRRNERSRAALIGTTGWVNTRAHFDALEKSLAGRWEIDRRLFERETKERANETALLALWNGGCDLILHAGHGNPGDWEQCFSTGALRKLTNRERVPIVFSAGCSTAYFAALAPYDGYVDVTGAAHAGSDHGEVFTAPPPPPANYQRGKYNKSGLGEELVRMPSGGAVAYIGCNTGSQPCGLTLQRGFIMAAAEPRIRVGDAWNEALRYYYAHERLADLQPDTGWYPPSIFFQGMKFMLFGDPTIEL